MADVFPFYSENTISEGNVTSDPRDISKDQDGSVVVLRIAANYRKYNGDEGTRYRNVKVSNTAAVHVWNSISTGDRVIVYGRIEGNDYKNKDGDWVESDTIIADFIGVSMRFHDVQQLRGQSSSRSNSDDDEAPRRRSSRRRSSGDEEEEAPRRRSSRRSNSDDDEAPRRRSSRRSSVETRGDDEDEDFED